MKKKKNSVWYQGNYLILPSHLHGIVSMTRLLRPPRWPTTPICETNMAAVRNVNKLLSASMDTWFDFWSLSRFLYLLRKELKELLKLNPFLDPVLSFSRFRCLLRLFSASQKSPHTQVLPRLMGLDGSSLNEADFISHLCKD